MNYSYPGGIVIECQEGFTIQNETFLLRSCIPIALKKGLYLSQIVLLIPLTFFSVFCFVVVYRQCRSMKQLSSIVTLLLTFGCIVYIISLALGYRDQQGWVLNFFFCIASCLVLNCLIFMIYYFCDGYSALLTHSPQILRNVKLFCYFFVPIFDIAWTVLSCASWSSDFHGHNYTYLFVWVTFALGVTSVCSLLVFLTRKIMEGTKEEGGKYNLVHRRLQFLVFFVIVFWIFLVLLSAAVIAWMVITDFQGQYYTLFFFLTVNLSVTGIIIILNGFFLKGALDKRKLLNKKPESFESTVISERSIDQESKRSGSGSGR